MDDVIVTYYGEQVSVPKEVAEFLERDHRRALAQDKQDTRHLTKSSFETVLPYYNPVGCSAEDDAIRNLQLENLRKAVAELGDQEQKLLSLRYWDELTMQEIGKVFGISKMAVSKRLKTLHKKLGDSVI